MSQTGTALRNRQCRLAAYPQGTIRSEDVAFVDSPVPALGTDEVLLAVHYISVDPALRLYMDPESFLGRNPKRRSLMMQVGDVMRAWVVGEVIASNSPDFPPGSFARDIMGVGGVQAYTILPGSALVAVDSERAPLTAYLGVLGMPGLTAYAGVVDVGQARAGEVMVVSGAAGAVGGIAGQVAKAEGCRVIGIAGGPDKCAYVERELGFDSCIDHKAGDLDGVLGRLCPEGIDIYFDNVGGALLDACLDHLAMQARIVGCGFISGYSEEIAPLRNYMNLLSHQARWECFSYFNLVREPERCARAIEILTQWLTSGAVRHHEQVFAGLESFVPAMREIYSGRNKGKVMLSLAPTDPEG